MMVVAMMTTLMMVDSYKHTTHIQFINISLQLIVRSNWNRSDRFAFLLFSRAALFL